MISLLTVYWLTTPSLLFRRLIKSLLTSYPWRFPSRVTHNDSLVGKVVVVYVVVGVFKIIWQEDLLKRRLIITVQLFINVTGVVLSYFASHG